MTMREWQLSHPVSAILFDCDGTLSAIEGIDELAKYNNVTDTVKSLTEEAMGTSGINPFIYQQRLDLVQPTSEQVHHLGQQYYHHLVTDVNSTITIFKRLNKHIYILSAGLLPAVKLFGGLLGIADTNIFAVDIKFDARGKYVDFDRTSPLIHNDGKRKIVSGLQSIHPDMLYVGDGMNDFAVYDLVRRFVGFGGVFYRENVASRCDYYINHPVMSLLLPLALTQEEVGLLTPSEMEVYHKGITLL